MTHHFYWLKEIEVPTAETFTEGSITITVGMPLFTDQYLLEKQVREKTLNDQATVTINETIGEAFIGETSKFIKRIEVSVNGQTQDLNYQDLPFPKKYAVLEKLPTKSVKQILKYLEVVSEIQRKVTRIPGVDEAGITQDIDFTVDSSLFALN